VDLRPFRVLLWTAAALLVVELGLEARAVSRGWEGFLLGKHAGWNTDLDPLYGPDAEFPFRSLRIEPERDPARKRLWLASSSYGEDIQLLPGEIFPNRLVQELGAGGVTAEMLNASRAGLHVRSNTSELGELGPVWKPDVVLLYQMSNDIDHISELDARAAAGAEPGTPGAAEEPAAAGPSLVARWAERMTTYRHLKTQVTTRLTSARPLRDDLGEDGEALYLARVSEFVDVARRLGTEPVLCTFATSHGPADLAELPPAYEQQILSINVELSMRGWAATVERWNEGLRNLARAEGLMLVDVAAEMRGRPELFRDFWHFTPEGHAQVAGVIARTLLEARR